MGAVEFGDLLEQLLRLLGRELHVANVVDAVAVHLEVVVAMLRLHRVRAQQRVRHERAGQSESRASHRISVASRRAMSRHGRIRVERRLWHEHGSLNGRHGSTMSAAHSSSERCSQSKFALAKRTKAMQVANAFPPSHDRNTG